MYLNPYPPPPRPLEQTDASENVTTDLAINSVGGTVTCTWRSRLQQPSTWTCFADATTCPPWVTIPLFVIWLLVPCHRYQTYFVFCQSGERYIAILRGWRFKKPGTFSDHEHNILLLINWALLITVRSWQNNSHASYSHVRETTGRRQVRLFL